METESGYRRQSSCSMRRWINMVCWPTEMNAEQADYDFASYTSSSISAATY